MVRSMLPVRLLAAALPLLGAGGCQGTRPPGTEPPVTAAPTPKDRTPQLGAVLPGAPRPLAPFATRPLAIYPLQRIAPGDSLGWAARAATAAFDDELRFALAGRTGLSAWRGLADVERAAKRATPYSPTLRDLPVEALVGRLDDRNRWVPATVAESVRILSGLVDVRWVLLPAQLRFVPAPEGGQLASVRLVLVDVRTGEIAAAADVRGEPATAWSPAVIAGLAGRVADQFVAP